MDKKQNQLQIDIPQEEFQPQIFRSHRLLNLSSSTRNLHENMMLQHTFKGNYALGVQIKLMSVNKLQREQKQLLYSFQSLKQGALSALIQKEEAIQTLKEKCQNYEIFGKQKSLRQLSYELEKLLQKIIQLQEQRQCLKKQLDQYRVLYHNDIIEKQYLIELLSMHQIQVQQKMESIYKSQSSINELVIEEQQRKRSLILQKQKIQRLLSCSTNPEKQINLIHKILDKDEEQKLKMNSPTSSLSTNSNFFDSMIFKKRWFKTFSNELIGQLDHLMHRHQQKVRALKRFYKQQIEILKFNIHKNRLQLHYRFDIPVVIKQQSSNQQSNLNQKQKSPEIRLEQSISSEQSKVQILKVQQQQMLPVSYRIVDKKTLESIFLQQDTNLTIKMNKKMESSYYQNVNNKKQKRKQKISIQWSTGMSFAMGLLAGGTLIYIIKKIIRR